MQITQKNSKYAIATAIVFIMLVGGFSYSTGLSGPFLLDDFGVFVNQNQTLIDLTWNELSVKANRDTSGKLGRVIPVAHLLLLKYFAGETPVYFKVANLLIHLLNAILVLFLVRTWVKYKSNKLSDNASLAIPFAAAIIWFCHPILVSTVLYSVQVMTLYSALFSILALLVYSILRSSTISRPPTKCLAIGCLLFTFIVCGVLSKENAALIPLYILLVELFIFRSGSKRKSSASEKVIFATMVIAPLTAGAIYLAFRFNYLTNYDFRSFTLHERLLSQIHMIVFYVKQILLPNISQMSIYLDSMPVQSSFDMATGLKLFFIVVLISSAILSYKTCPLYGLGIMFFFSGHILESTIFPLEMGFEHRNYLPSIGLLLALTTGAGHVFSKLKIGNSFTVFIVVLIFVSFTALTTMRVQRWQNESALATAMYSTYPNSPRTLIYVATLFYDHANFSESMRVLSELEHHLEDATPHLMQLFLLCNSDINSQPLVDKSKSRLKSFKISATSVNGLKSILGKYLDNQCPSVSQTDMLAMLEIAYENAKINARFTELPNHLLAMRANLQEKLGNTELAEKLYIAATQDSQSTKYYLPRLAVFYATHGRKQQALETLDKVRDLANTNRKNRLSDIEINQVADKVLNKLD